MKTKFIAIAGALISLILSACTKSEPSQANPDAEREAVSETNTAEQPAQPSEANPAAQAALAETQPVREEQATVPENTDVPDNTIAKQQTNVPDIDDDISVEDYVNGIAEYVEYDVKYDEYDNAYSRPAASLYGARGVFGGSAPDSTSRNRSSRTLLHQHVKKRCLKEDSKHCEYIDLKSKRIISSSAFKSFDSNYKFNIDTIEAALKKNKPHARTRKYSVGFENLKNTVIRKVCPVNGKTVSKSCQCNVMKDLCGNYIDKDGYFIYKDDLLKRGSLGGRQLDSRKVAACSKQAGSTTVYLIGSDVDCNHPFPSDEPENNQK